jgi:hypothetical protein
MTGTLVLSFHACFFCALSGEHRGPAQPLPGGEFLIGFKRDAVDQPGVDRLAAVRNYMLKNKFIPDECPGDIKVLRSGDTQGGHGWAVFVCIYVNQD